MGRHSVPDPDETPEDPRTPRGHVPEGYTYDEPDYRPGYSDAGYRESAHVEADDTGAQPGGAVPGEGADYDAEFDDADYDADYDDADYDGADYDGADYDGADYADDEYEEPAPGEPGHESDYWRQDERDYRYDEPDAPTRSFATNPPPPRPPVTGPAHGGDWEGGEWTGSHRAVKAGRRGVSVGVIAALVTVVVVVGAVILWRFFGDALSNRSVQAAARCVEGEVAVAVVADPSIAEPLKGARRQVQPDRCPGRRPLRQGRSQAGRIGRGGRRFRRNLARRPRRASGAVDPR